jgi:hypothetical protein
MMKRKKAQRGFREQGAGIKKRLDGCKKIKAGMGATGA